MPVARSWARLTRLRERERRVAEAEERRFRIGLHTMANIHYHVGIMLQQPPESQAEYNKRRKIEMGKGQPNWGRINDARRRRDKHDEGLRDALEHPHDFETLFRFASPETGEGHLFPKPPPKPTADEVREYYDRLDRQANEQVVDMLKKVKEARRKRREQKKEEGRRSA